MMLRLNRRDGGWESMTEEEKEMYPATTKKQEARF